MPLKCRGLSSKTIHKDSLQYTYQEHFSKLFTLDSSGGKSFFSKHIKHINFHTLNKKTQKAQQKIQPNLDAGEKMFWPKYGFENELCLMTTKNYLPRNMNQYQEAPMKMDMTLKVSEMIVFSII